MLHSILSLIRYLGTKILGEGSVLRTRPMTSIKPLICMTEIRPKNIRPEYLVYYRIIPRPAVCLLLHVCSRGWRERQLYCGVVSCLKGNVVADNWLRFVEVPRSYMKNASRPVMGWE